MHAASRISPQPPSHSFPKYDRSRPESSGSVQLIVSVMLTHAGYDPVR
jgi:hypothetical protein